MDKEALKRRARDPRHIRGIYNYCDRWCERCGFTSRCLTHSMQQEEKEAGDGNGDDRVMEKVAEFLDLAFQLLQDFAEEEGIDLDAVEIEEDEEETPVVHILSRMAGAYIDMADRWFEKNPMGTETGLPEEKPHLKLVHPRPTEIPVEEFVEIIRFYQYPIHVKLERALSGKREERQYPLEGLPKDSDGSAKVALIELDRSIGAWCGVLNAFPDQENETLKIIRHLKRIRDIAEKEFPDARAFIRPGFDEVC